MHFDPLILRITVGIVGLLLFGSFLIKDSLAQTTTEGMVFRSRPLLASAEMLVAPVIILSFVHIISPHKQLELWVFTLLVFAALAVGLMRMPGAITLTPAAITQKFWFQPSKTIQYTEITAIQTKAGSSSITRVLGEDRVKIVHSSKQRAAKEFRQELERRTGKRAT
ncbi:MAG TPA: hypothetical protein VK684_13845 [Edaphobacter sp.]|jgi:hypothetical protein|nr:hypothetical protein [Edaphobacter sp.]